MLKDAKQIFAKDSLHKSPEANVKAGAGRRQPFSSRNVAISTMNSLKLGGLENEQSIIPQKSQPINISG